MTPQAIEFIIILYVFLIGIIIGSYLNVCIYRLPREISTAKGRSFCPSCEHPLHAMDLVPVFSYLFLKGKCRYCKTYISKRYPMIEFITGILFVLVYLRFGLTWYFILYAFIASVLVVIAMIDYDTLEIHDRMHVFIAIPAIILLVLHTANIFYHVLGALIISVPLYILMVITKGGIGGGDVKLMAASGLLLGAYEILLAMIIGSITAGIMAIFLIISKKKSRKDMIAFGPYLCLGIFVSMLYGTQLIAWYIGLLT